MKLNDEKVKECMVHNCTNVSNQGQFIGDVCLSCYDFIVEGKGQHSQVFRNATIEIQKECHDFIAKLDKHLPKLSEQELKYITSARLLK